MNSTKLTTFVNKINISINNVKPNNPNHDMICNCIDALMNDIFNQDITRIPEFNGIRIIDYVRKINGTYNVNVPPGRLVHPVFTFISECIDIVNGVNLNLQMLMIPGQQINRSNVDGKQIAVYYHSRLLGCLMRLDNNDRGFIYEINKNVTTITKRNYSNSKLSGELVYLLPMCVDALKLQTLIDLFDSV